MDIQVTIKISKEALGEACSVLREILAQVPEAGSPTQQTETAVPYGQQIAEHFPQANTAAPVSQAPVSQPAPQPAPAALTAPAPTAPAPAQQPAPVPTTEHAYTIEELQVAAGLLVDRGMMVQVQGLLPHTQSFPDRRVFFTIFPIHLGKTELPLQQFFGMIH